MFCRVAVQTLRKMPTAATVDTESTVVGQEPPTAGAQNDEPMLRSEISSQGFRKATATADEGGATSEGSSQRSNRVGPAVSTIARVADELARARREQLEHNASQKWEERIAGRRVEWEAKKAAKNKGEAEARAREAEAKALADLAHHPNPLVQVPDGTVTTLHTAAALHARLLDD